MSSFINPTTLFHSNLTTTLYKQPRASLSGNQTPSHHRSPAAASSRRKTISTLLISTSLAALVGGARAALAAGEQKWGTRSFLWEHFFESGLSPEDAAARIKNTAEGLHELKHMVETMSWRYLIFYIRLKSAYLKQDMKAALSTVPTGRRRDYIDTANELIDNMAESLANFCDNSRKMTTPLTYSHLLGAAATATAIARPNSLNLVYRSCRSKIRCNSSRPELNPNQNHPRLIDSSPSIIHRIPCGCGRRFFMEAVGSASLIHALSPCACSSAPVPESSKDVLNKFHPPKPDWYNELYARVLNKFMKSYEAEVAGYKSQLFDQLRGKVKDILEIGIGTGPNLKFYAGDAGVNVIGADPNDKMEKYARASAEATGLPSANFQFVQAVGFYLFSLIAMIKSCYTMLTIEGWSGDFKVGEALPLADASVDAVIGTLVLCSVTDVNRTLEEIKRVLRPGGFYLFLEHVGAKDGTLLRFVQNILNPVQKFVSDGCHLTRETGNYIAEAGFSELDSNMVFVSKASLVNPQIYGIARN